MKTFEQIIVKIKKIFIPCQENDFKPKILAGNFLIYFLIALILLKIVYLGFLIGFANHNFFADVSKTVLIELLNKERRGAGICQVSENSKLSYAAGLKAQDMMNNDYFSHNSPQGITPWYWFRKAEYNYYYAGENLGIGFIDSGEIHNAWNNSPLHKENLLNKNYNEIGIAILKGDFKGVENTIVVQLFGSQYQNLPIYPEESQPADVVDKVIDLPELPKSGNTEENTFSADAVEGKPADSAVLGSEYLSNYKAIDIEESSNVESGIKFRFFKFMAMSSHNILESFIFYSLIFVSLLLMLNILVKINIQYKGLTFKVIGILFLLVLCVYINKDLMLKFIPHVVSIY